MRSASVVGIVIVFSAASVAAAAPPREPSPCSPSRSAVRMTRAPLSPGAICGSRFADRIYTRGHLAYAYAGNDTIYARNGKSDEIWGGPGRDRAYVDRRDVVRNVERVIRR